MKYIKVYGILGLLLMVLLSACGSAATPKAAPTSALADVITAEATTPAPQPETPQATAPDMADDPAARNDMYAAPPAMQIDPQKTYVATIETERGNIVLELHADKVPATVNNFVFLAREGFYDNTTFHRVIPGFMAQGGDPTGSGMGGPGYRFADEFDPSLAHDRVGVLSMANAGPGTNGSQFFITFTPTPWLDDRHSVFGHVIDGLDVLFALRERDPQTAATPGDRIVTIRIAESSAPAVSKLPANTEIPMPEAPAARLELYLQPPKMMIDPAKAYVATIKTARGDIVVNLDAQAAPLTVNNFVFLARAGFFDGLTFHRVEPGFVIQGGDPLGSGQGGPGYLIPAEIGLRHEEGAIAMARLPDQGNPRRLSSGSQFYITLAPTPQLDGGYTVFGKVASGMEIVKSIAVGDVIESITITER